MVFSLMFALFTSFPETEPQKQIRGLERRLHQFPPADVVRDNLELSMCYLSWLQRANAIAPVHQRDAMTTRIAEARHLYGVWSSLNRATTQLGEVKMLVALGRKDNRSPSNRYWPQTVEKLLSLAEMWIDGLESTLGEENFGAGRMPPPVPVWRFQFVD
jgi:hypothetical protein